MLVLGCTKGRYLQPKHRGIISKFHELEQLAWGFENTFKRQRKSSLTRVCCLFRFFYSLQWETGVQHGSPLMNHKCRVCQTEHVTFLLYPQISNMSVEIMKFVKRENNLHTLIQNWFRSSVVFLKIQNSRTTRLLWNIWLYILLISFLLFANWALRISGHTSWLWLKLNMQVRCQIWLYA